MPAKKPGPAPKRSTQRRRRNKTTTTTAAAGPPSTKTESAPEGELYGKPLTGTHSAAAKRFWDALRRSGQAQFYEPSDWAVAELVVISIDTFARKPSAMMLAAINSMLSGLLVTEADRRRIGLELEKPAPVTDGEGDPKVTALDAYRDRAQALSS